MWNPFKKKKCECIEIPTDGTTRKFIIPVDSMSRKEAEKNVKKLMKEYEEDYFFPVDLPYDELTEEQKLNITEDNWKELTIQEKLDRKNEYLFRTAKLPEGWTDWNQLSLDELSDYLEKKYMFSSSGDALAISKLIKFYRDNK